MNLVQGILWAPPAVIFTIVCRRSRSPKACMRDEKLTTQAEGAITGVLREADSKSVRSLPDAVLVAAGALQWRALAGPNRLASAREPAGRAVGASAAAAADDVIRADVPGAAATVDLPTACNSSWQHLLAHPCVGTSGAGPAHVWQGRQPTRTNDAPAWRVRTSNTTSGRAASTDAGTSGPKAVPHFDHALARFMRFLRPGKPPTDCFQVTGHHHHTNVCRAVTKHGHAGMVASQGIVQAAFVAHLHVQERHGRHGT